MAFDPRSIDESPLFKLLTSVVTEGPGFIAGKLGALAQGISGSIGGVETRSEGAGFIAGLKESLLGGREGQSHERAAQPTPALEIATPAPSLAKYEVPVEQLGSLSAPTFGGGVVQQSGISMRG